MEEAAAEVRGAVEGAAEEVRGRQLRKRAACGGDLLRSITGEGLH